MGYGTYLPDEEQYVVHNVKEIMQILTDLSKQKVMLKASFNHGHDIYLTTIIALSEKNNAVYLDIGRDDAFNSRLLASEHVVFSKEDGVRIKWLSEKITEVALKDGRAIKVAMPQELVRLQRREFFRLATPIVDPVPCQIPIDNGNPDQERVLELILADVSLGGICAIAPDPLDAALTIGASFDRCKISFPDVGVTSLTLQVRNIAQIHMKDGAIKYRVGMEFIEPSRGNQGLIQRYTFNLERIAIALMNGGSK
ncbi:flagellar brake protein YcgR [mine drainage metagenome]|uniref:Flagellar brake protein YcgR n=1 Tax=mine drainage metagenome TaxID=410659 RepID=A0A1J5T7V3_9ZZZZ